MINAISRTLVRALVLPITAVLCACSVLPERVPVELYELPPSTLEPSTQEQGATTPALSSLRLATPSASDALATTRLLVQVQNNSFQAHPGARWAAAVPVLWRDWLLDAFWRDGRVTALSTSSDGLQSALELGGMLRSLHHDYGDRSVAVIRFDARLIDTASRRILASRRFEAEAPVQGNAPADVVSALGVAADELARELIPWTLEQGSSSFPNPRS